MKSRFFVLFVCLFASATLIGCFGGSSDNNTVVTAATVSGKVLDSATSVGIVATVTDGTQTTTSAADGSYTLSNVTAGADGKVKLTVESAGYLTGYAFEPVSAGYTTTANITIVSKAGAVIDTPVDLTAAGETLTFNTLSIVLPQNSVIDAAGNPVAAPVVSVIHKTPPKTAAAMDAFPGVFAGIPTNGTAVTPFETFGFVNVDLGAGNSLDPAIGASLTIPLGDNNPTVGAYALEMPLWRFDTADGIWKQVATATRLATNAPFSAHVTTFSWYNLDAPVNVSRLDVIVASYTSTLNEWEVAEGSVTDPGKTDLSKRIAGARVVVTATSQNAAEGVWGTLASDNIDNFTWRESRQTNSSGVASFNIPAGRKFSIKVMTSTGEKSGYMYEVKDGIATAFMNMGSYALHNEGTFGATKR